MLKWLKKQIIAPPSDPVGDAVGRQDRQGGEADDDSGSLPGRETTPSGNGLLGGLAGLVAGAMVAEAILSTGRDEDGGSPGEDFAEDGGEDGGEG